MKIKFLVFCSLFYFAPAAFSQTVLVHNWLNMPVAGAHISLQSLTKPTEKQVYTTGKSGACLLSGLQNYPYLLTLMAFGFQSQTDTLFSAHDILYHLADSVLQDVVITGQYVPGNPENAVQKIQIIDRKKIDAMGAQNLRDVLTNQLNIRLSQDAILGSGMTLQGMGGQDVKILVDGVPAIGRHNGNIDLSQINLNTVERIEVIEGPMSVSYGTDAIAGTINLITQKTPSKKLSVGLSAYSESIGTYNTNGSITLHHNKHSIRLTGGRNFFTGWSPANTITPLDFAAHVADSTRYQSWKPRTQYMAGGQYSLTMGKITFTYTGNYFNELIVNRGYPLAPYGENTFDGYYRTTRTDNAVFLKYKFNTNIFLNAQASYNTYSNIANTYYVDLTTLERIISNANGQQDTSLFKQAASRGTISSNYTDRKLNYEAGYDMNVQYANGSMMKAGVQQMGDYALFASVEYKPVNGLVIRPGIRYAYNTNYSAPFVPSIHMAYTITEKLKLRASYATGFRAPSLQELYFYFVDINHNIIGNTGLTAEHSSAYNSWLTYKEQVNGLLFKAEAGFFYNDIRNLITLAQTGNGNEYSYINIGQYKTKGIQINNTLSSSRLGITLGGSLTGTYNELSENYTIHTYSYSPELRSAISYAFPKQNLWINLFYKYTGKATGYTIDAANAVSQTFINPYNIADLSFLKHFIGKKLSLTIGCKNVFNIRNITYYASGTAHASSGPSVLIGMGRYYFIKADINITSEK